MIKPRIIVTGATGKTGSIVVTELLKDKVHLPVADQARSLESQLRRQS